MLMGSREAGGAMFAVSDSAALFPAIGDPPILAAAKPSDPATMTVMRERTGHWSVARTLKSRAILEAALASKRNSRSLGGLVEWRRCWRIVPAALGVLRLADDSARRL
jgi:hypothetical protein